MQRRKFLSRLAAAGLLPLVKRRITEGSEKADDILVYVSSWTQGEEGSDGGGGLHVYRLDMSDGSLQLLGDFFPELNAGYLAVATDGEYLYAADERKDRQGNPGSGGGIFAFKIDKTSGHLTPLNNRSSMGTYPCYLSIDRSGSHLIVANHGSSFESTTQVVEGSDGSFKLERHFDDGTVALFPVANNGEIGELCDVHVLEGSGPLPMWQDSPHPHSALFDPTGRWALVCNKAGDRLLTYDIGGSGCTLSHVTITQVPEGTTPRHSAFHPTLPYVFVVNEASSSLSAFHFDQSNGKLKAIGTWSTLPDGYSKTNSCADIRVHPNGKYVYGSNRGHNSIARFRIDVSTGRLQFMGNTPTGGETPRAFNIEPSGRFLFVANQNSDNVVTFDIDAATGEPRPAGPIAVVKKPVCLQFLSV